MRTRLWRRRQKTTKRQNKTRFGSIGQWRWAGQKRRAAAKSRNAGWAGEGEMTLAGSAVVSAVRSLVPPLGLLPAERIPLAAFLRVSGLTEKAAGSVLGVSASTISRDLTRHRHSQAPSSEDVAERVGQLVAFCDEIQRLAYNEIGRLSAAPSPEPAALSVKLSAIRVLVRAERLRLSVLAGAGLLTLRRRRRRHRAKTSTRRRHPTRYPGTL